MGRLKPELLDRVNAVVDRMLDAADALASKKVSSRIVEQMYSCTTSVGANAWEADAAMSRKDFCRCLGISVKKANECRFWLSLAVRRGWFAATKVTPMLAELEEVQKILRSMIRNTREKGLA